MANFRTNELNIVPHPGLQTTAVQNTIQDFARVEGLVQAQTAGVNVGWQHPVLTPSLEGEYSQQYLSSLPQNQSVFINTPLQSTSSQPNIGVPTSLPIYYSNAPKMSTVPEVPSTVRAHKNRNPYHVNPRLYRHVIPRGTYQGNDHVKRFLLFFNELNHQQKAVIDYFMAFQIENITNKIIDQHNKEIDSLKIEIKNLQDKLISRPTLEELEENNELTTINYHNELPPWDAVSIRRLIDDDLTTLGEFPQEDDDTVEDPSEDRSKTPTLSSTLDEDLLKMSFRATTNNGFAKVRAQKLPNFGPGIITELKRLSAIPFLTSNENRENGDTFYFLAGLIQKANPSVTFHPLIVTKADIMRAFSKFKAFKKNYP